MVSFHSLWIGTYVPHTNAHVNKTADSAERSSFPVTKALEVWKRLRQSFCCLSRNPQLHFPHPLLLPSLSPFFVLTLIQCVNSAAVHLVKNTAAKVVEENVNFQQPIQFIHSGHASVINCSPSPKPQRMCAPPCLFLRHCCLSASTPL